MSGLRENRDGSTSCMYVHVLVGGGEEQGP